MLQLLAVAYLDRIGLGAQPYLVYQHLDAAHPHLHVVTCCIQSSGRWIDTFRTGFIPRVKIRMEMEELFGSSPISISKGGPISPIYYGLNSTSSEIGRTIDIILSTYHFVCIRELNAILRGYHLLADRGKEGNLMYRNRGLLYRVLDGQGRVVGPPFRASTLPGKPILGQLEKITEGNRPFESDRKEKVHQKIRHILDSQHFSTPLDLLTILNHLKVWGVSIPELYWVDEELKTTCSSNQLGLPFPEEDLVRAIRLKQALSGSDQPNFSPVPPHRLFPGAAEAGSPSGVLVPPPGSLSGRDAMENQFPHGQGKDKPIQAWEEVGEEGYFPKGRRLSRV